MIVRSLLFLAASSALAVVARAQIQRPEHIAPPGHTHIIDELDTGLLMGTSGQDWFQDDWGGDVDHQYDGPGGPDGKRDRLDTRDGDASDSMFGGPEDSFDGDGGDKVFILRPVGWRGRPMLWSGTYDEYVRTRALLRWVLDQADRLLADHGDPGEPGSFWAAASVELAAMLEHVDPDPDETVSYAEHFPIGPYVVGDVPSTPYDFLAWAPYEIDPVEATAELEMSYAEFVAARDAVLELLADFGEACAEL